MIKHDHRGEFIVQAKKAGFTVLTMSDKEIKWKGTKPSDAVFKQLQFATEKSMARQGIVHKMAKMAASLVSKYPKAEQQGWTEKLNEAKAIKAGTLKVEEAFQLKLEAAITGEKVADLATATLQAAQLTGMIPAIMAGLRRRLEAAIDKAKTVQELSVIEKMADTLRTNIMTAFATGDAAKVQQALSSQ